MIFLSMKYQSVHKQVNKYHSEEISRSARAGATEKSTRSNKLFMLHLCPRGKEDTVTLGYG